MFQFPRVRLLQPMYSVAGYPSYDRWVSPFGNRPDHKVVYQFPERLSQITTSFIASDCLGIHRMRLVT